jgi:hypothetical protein
MAGVAAEIGDRWRDLGPALWITASALGAVWFALLGVCAALTEPRKVDPGPQTLDLGGPEPPAVANLIAGDWRLGPESLPATLLDLAARKHLRIDQVGEQTYVRLGGQHRSGGDQPLLDYEEMVLAHVRGLASQNDDGAVPAEALTTGPDADSKGWWRRFRKAVEVDARRRGLSRARWSPAVHTLLLSTAAAVALAIGLAVSSLPDTDDSNTTSTSSDEDDGNPVVGGLVVAALAWVGIGAIAESVGSRERDTPAGRDAAARWLGFRELLGQDTVFGEQPPAGVAIWDRHLAYGATLGLAHAAVRALPLGAESDTSAWSPVGGRWRVVRIRYPRFRPGYGRHPLRVAAIGLLVTAAGLVVLTRLPFDVKELLDPLHDDATVGEYAQRDDVELVGQIVLTSVVVGFALATAVGVWMLLVGLTDLVGGRRQVEGRVLRYRVRGSDDDKRWYIAVDDGTTNEIRAWRFHHTQRADQGTTVRAAVTRHLQHVRDFEVAPTTVTVVDADSAEGIHDPLSAPSE